MAFNKKSLLKTVKLTVTVGLFYLLSRLIDFKAFGENLATANYWWLLVGAGFIGLNYVVGAIRWSVLLGEPAIKWPQLLYFYFLGAFFNNFLPSSIGGDGYKMYRVAAITRDKPKAVVSVFMDRLTGVTALFCLSIGGLISFWGIKGLGILALFILGMVFGLFVLKKIANLHPLLKKLSDAVFSYQHKKKVLVKAFLLSFGVQACSVLAEVSAFYAMGVKVPLAYSFFVLPLVNFAAFLPVSVNSLGTQDVLFAFVYAPKGVSTDLAAAASIAYHFIRFGTSLIGGALYALESFRGKATPPPQKKDSP